MRPHVAIVFGTRPELIKMTPVVRRLRGAGWCRVSLCASGQHAGAIPAMLAAFGFEGVSVPPPFPGLDAQALVARLSERLQGELAVLRPDLVLVHGDTATAFAAAISAVKLGIPVGHVEAGLRTYDLEHPYPEESFRQAIARLADVHFAPTEAAARHLHQEGVAEGTVHVTGNTIVDMLAQMDMAAAVPGPQPRLALITLHRRELTPVLDAVAEGIVAGLGAHPDVRAVVPIDSHSGFADRLRGLFAGRSNIEVTPPLAYDRFLSLMSRASLVITDSGGIQEEAALLGRPLVIPRKVTERPEVLDGGRARLCGFAAADVASAIAWALSLSPRAAPLRGLGDGRAAERIEARLFDIFQSRRSWQDTGGRSAGPRSSAK